MAGLSGPANVPGGRVVSEPGHVAWSDILACERVVLRFTAAFDAGDLEGMLAEFSQDGVWQRQDGSVAGHAGLQDLMANRSPDLLVQHVISNMRVALTGPGKASCTSYVTVYRDDDGGPRPVPLRQPALVGIYHDQLRKAGEVWQLAGRRVAVDFKQP